MRFDMSYRSVFTPGMLEEQVIVVTGGGSGIGRCIAHELASLGAHVAIIGRNPEKLHTVIADIWPGWPHFSHSAASRGGMFTLSECAATEWASSGVRVNTVAPGSIASSGLDTYDEKDRDFIQNEVACEIPLQRFGTEAE